MFMNALKLTDTDAQWPSQHNKLYVPVPRRNSMNGYHAVQGVLRYIVYTVSPKQANFNKL